MDVLERVLVSQYALQRPHCLVQRKQRGTESAWLFKEFHSSNTTASASIK